MKVDVDGLKCAQACFIHAIQIIPICALIGVLSVLHAGEHVIQTWDQFGPYLMHDAQMNPEKRVYRIPVPLPSFQVKELIPSWNMEAREGDRLDIQVEVAFEDQTTHLYQIGQWASGLQSRDGKATDRTSFNDQKNDYGAVYTDTLVLKKQPVACTLVLEMVHPSNGAPPSLKFVSVCLTGHSSADWEEDELTGKREPIELEVPRRCQLDYIGGRVWCSPTSVTMMLGYWANVLHRPDLEYSVPTVAQRIFDPGWPGTGNWPFNTAFAGEHAGMRAFVARLGSVDALYEMVSRGVPVATSVSYDLLKGKPEKGSNDGHLVVCIGFDEEGDPIFNDPARCPEVRWSYPMEHFSKAWQSSKRTVYLIFPGDRPLPLEYLENF